jgi:predicted RNase H-like HicB family nuclease
MLTYKAMYKYLDEGVHAEVLDFPGVISFGETLEEARRMLASALVDMAELICFATNRCLIPIR